MWLPRFPSGEKVLYNAEYRFRWTHAKHMCAHWEGAFWKTLKAEDISFTALSLRNGFLPPGNNFLNLVSMYLKKRWEKNWWSHILRTDVWVFEFESERVERVAISNGRIREWLQYHCSRCTSDCLRVYPHPNGATESQQATEGHKVKMSKRKTQNAKHKIYCARQPPPPLILIYFLNTLSISTLIFI